MTNAHLFGFVIFLAQFEQIVMCLGKKQKEIFLVTTTAKINPPIQMWGCCKHVLVTFFLVTLWSLLVTFISFLRSFASLFRSMHLVKMKKSADCLGKCLSPAPPQHHGRQCGVTAPSQPPLSRVMSPHTILYRTAHRGGGHFHS